MLFIFNLLSRHYICPVFFSPWWSSLSRSS